MSETPPTPDLWQRAWDVIAEIRDAAARTPDDADTGDIVDALIEAGLLRQQTLTDDDLWRAYLAGFSTSGQTWHGQYGEDGTPEQARARNVRVRRAFDRWTA